MDSQCHIGQMLPCYNRYLLFLISLVYTCKKALKKHKAMWIWYVVSMW